MGWDGRDLGSSVSAKGWVQQYKRAGSHKLVATIIAYTIGTIGYVQFGMHGSVLIKLK
jgi:hypothetical protein